jgi:hypothetical protein
VWGTTGDYLLAKIVSIGRAAASATGLLAYRGAYQTELAELAWLDRTGRVIASLGEPRAYQYIRLSPDERRGRTLAYGRA